MNKNTPYDELYHYGVKGQKWGVRRYEKWKSRSHKGIDKRYDKKVTKSKKKTLKAQIHAKTKDEFDAAKKLSKRDKYVYNSLRKLEHKRVNDVTLERFQKYRQAVNTQMTLGVLFGLPGTMAGQPMVTANEINDYRATSKDKQKFIDKYYKK